MQTRRWTNPSQPQTLQIAVFLFYINAVFTALFGGLLSPIGLLIIVGLVASGFGIANDQKWGYVLGVIIAGLAVAFVVVLPLADDLGRIVDPAFLINALFPVALFALLLHPMSRSYQRIWFE
jgi:predicted MFS family arabinose efflux permease